MMNTSITTTVIGSYPVSIQRKELMKSYFQKQRIPSWKPYIKQAVDDMIKAGIDLISDGQTRDPFISIFARGFNGFQVRDRTTAIDKITFTSSVTAADLSYVRSLLPPQTRLLGLLVGPYTLSESVQNTYYSDKKEMAFDIAEALRLEAHAIQPYVDVISIDEPFYANQFPEYAFDLIKHITSSVHCPTRLHACGNIEKHIPKLLDLPVDILSHEFCATPSLFDGFKQYFDGQKDLCIGVVRSDQTEVESISEIQKHIQKGRDIFGSHLKQVAPDCGLRLLPQPIAQQKISNIVKAVKET